MPPEEIQGDDPEKGGIIDRSEDGALRIAQRLGNGILPSCCEKAYDCKQAPVLPWHWLPIIYQEWKGQKNHCDIGIDGDSQAVFCLCKAPHQDFVECS